jgi:hypothetical protein
MTFNNYKHSESKYQLGWVKEKGEACWLKSTKIGLSDWNDLADKYEKNWLQMSQYATLLAHSNRLGAPAVISSEMKQKLSPHFANLRLVIAPNFSILELEYVLRLEKSRMCLWKFITSQFVLVKITKSGQI